MLKLRLAAPLFSVALVFALGAAAARVVAAGHPAQAFAPDVTQPLVVVTAWGPFGGACFAVLAVTLVLAALAAYGAVCACAFAAPGAGPVALAAAAALVAAGAWPFVFSSDVYAYAAYGWLAAHGGAPYAPVPPALHAPLIEAARRQWQGSFPPCVYGPAFVAAAREIVALTGGRNVAAALIGLRLAAGAAFVLCIFALAAALRDLSPRRRFVLLAAFALNPVALWSVAEGHNDALVLLMALFGFALVRRGAIPAGAFLVGVSAIVKATGAAFAAGLVLEALAFAPAMLRSLRLPLSLGLAAALAIALPPLLPELTAAGHGRYLPTGSLQSLAGPAPVLCAASAAAGYGLLRLHGRTRDGFAWLGIAAWLALPNPYPWYALWLLPAAGAAGGGYVAAALYGVTFSSVLRYLPDATGNTGASELHVVAALTASPLLLAFAPILGRFPFRKTSPT